MKICIILGTRPQIIKCQPLINEITSKNLPLTIIHTGQHFDYKMSKAFFKELDIPSPNYHLGIKSISPLKQLGEIIRKLENPLKKINPSIVIIPGDTRSALGGAIASSRLHIPLAHLEAGARSYQNQMEEEVNRRLIDHCSNFLFAPTMNCLKNLNNENVFGKSYFTGDTMFDIFLKYKKLLKLKPQHNSDFVLLTLHRRENIYNIINLKKILKILKIISKNDLKIIFPVHPHTKKQLKKLKFSLNNICIIEPVNYSEMLKLLSKTRLLLTDSGGLQKEAFWLNTPTVTLRSNTEWVETLSSHYNILWDELNLKKFSKFLQEKIKNKHLKHTKKNLFGNGHAARKIVSIFE